MASTCLLCVGGRLLQRAQQSYISRLSNLASGGSRAQQLLKWTMGLFMGRRFWTILPVVALVLCVVASLNLVASIFGQNAEPVTKALPCSSAADKRRLAASLRAATASEHDARPALFTPPLRTRGRYIVDARGERFKLASVNWYGASDELHVPGGLDIQHRDAIAQTIRQLGFNSVRLPYADQMVRDNRIVDARVVAANPDLVGARSLDVFGAVVESLTRAGLAVIINDHITQCRWCGDGNLCDAMWTNSLFSLFCPVKQTEDDWIRHWETIMRPHIGNSLVVGADLRNEPRGLFGRLGWNSWVAAAERLGERLLEMQPNWLIIVEGTYSSNYLSLVKERPVRLSRENRLVYSAHVYGWSGWGAANPYWSRPYDSFAEDMQRNWGFLLSEGAAPVWVGEFGAPENPNKGDMHYWTNLMKYMTMMDVDFGFWALNPRKPKDNVVESYGLVEDDWKTPKLDYRLCGMARMMRSADVDDRSISSDY